MSVTVQLVTHCEVFLGLCFAVGGRGSSAQPHGLDGQNPHQEQEEFPQSRRQHQEEALRTNVQPLQRHVQSVRALVSQRRLGLGRFQQCQCDPSANAADLLCITFMNVFLLQDASDPRSFTCVFEILFIS